MSKDVIAEFGDFLGGELEETGRRDDSDFDPTWEPVIGSILIGRYQGSREVKTKFGQKKVHKFADAQTGQSKDDMQQVGSIEAWGCTVLDERLNDYSKGDRVLVMYEGQASGSNAHIYRTYRAKAVTA